jgi:hypothetical protein
MPHKPPLENGSNWSSPKGIAGLGGFGREISIGEYNLHEIPYPVVATLILAKRTLEELPAVPGQDGCIAARIVYGIGTASDEILVDWNFGSSITMPAGTGHVNVYAQQRSPWLDGTNGEMFQRVHLAAMLAAGSRSSLGAPTLSQITFIKPFLLPADVVIVPVPNRAKRLQVNSSKGATSDVQVNLNTGLAVAKFTLAGDPELRWQGVIIPGATRQVSLTSNVGETVLPVTLNWILDG